MRARSVYHWHNKKTLSGVEREVQKMYASFSRRELELACFNTDVAYSQTLHELYVAKDKVKELEAKLNAKAE